jgi:hypothetical protein
MLGERGDEAIRLPEERAGSKQSTVRDLKCSVVEQFQKHRAIHLHSNA